MKYETGGGELNIHLSPSFLSHLLQFSYFLIFRQINSHTVNFKWFNHKQLFTYDKCDTYVSTSFPPFSTLFYHSILFLSSSSPLSSFTFFSSLFFPFLSFLLSLSSFIFLSLSSLYSSFFSFFFFYALLLLSFNPLYLLIVPFVLHHCLTQSHNISKYERWFID